MTTKYYQVYEHYEEAEKPKRLVWTFAMEMEAHDLVEFLIKNNAMDPRVKVEEHEITT